MLGTSHSQKETEVQADSPRIPCRRQWHMPKSREHGCVARPDDSLQLLVSFCFPLLDCAKENARMCLWNLAIVVIRHSYKQQSSEIPPRYLNRMTNTCLVYLVIFWRLMKLYLYLLFSISWVMCHCIAYICQCSGRFLVAHRVFMHMHMCTCIGSASLWLLLVPSS
jgi:hypothetical protein